MNFFTKKIALLVGTVSLGVGIAAVASFAAPVSLPWTGPSATPPLNNAPTPLNVTNTGQEKIGGLVLNTGGAINGLIVDQGNVGIGTKTPANRLSVNGVINAMTNIVTGVDDPVADLDAVNLRYLKKSLQAATTGNGNQFAGGTIILYGLGQKSGAFPSAGDGVAACPAGYTSIPGYGPHSLYIDNSISYKELEYHNRAGTPTIEGTITADGESPIVLPAGVVGTFSICSASRTHVISENNTSGYVADACSNQSGTINTCNTCRICIPTNTP